MYTYIFNAYLSNSKGNKSKQWIKCSKVHFIKLNYLGGLDMYFWLNINVNAVILDVQFSFKIDLWDFFKKCTYMHRKHIARMYSKMLYKFSPQHNWFLLPFLYFCIFQIFYNEHINFWVRETKQNSKCWQGAWEEWPSDCIGKNYR